ncbi:MAG: F0F1 ATP synthase subunit A [Crocinitomix sp.]|nr:F0F1 ATP synthase subunit A [Crocinitomix sp.]
MKNYIRIILLLVVVSITSFASASAPNPVGAVGGSKKEFNAADHAIHHALDAHEIHVADGFVIPLPIILWTDNGLVTFMSSEFGHGDHNPPVERNGMSFVMSHEKIYQLNPGEHHLATDAEHHPTNAKKITMDFSITKNVFAMFIVAGLLLFVFVRSARKYKGGKPVAPSGIAKWTEPGVVFVQDIAKENIEGEKYKRFTPYLLTLFFFIFFGNLLGLIPFISNPNMTGSISVTLLLAAITFVIQMMNSKKTYWLHILDPLGDTLPWYGKLPLYLILIPIEIAGIFIKPVALLIRLFANITAGHIIVVSLISIIFVNESLAWAGLAVPMTLFISVLELLVAFLQAYIFTMLAAMYIGSAVESAHH